MFLVQGQGKAKNPSSHIKLKKFPKTGYVIENLDNFYKNFKVWLHLTLK